MTNPIQPWYWFGDHIISPTIFEVHPYRETADMIYWRSPLGADACIRKGRDLCAWSFPTYAEARDAMISKRGAAVARLEAELGRAKEQLEQARALPTVFDRLKAEAAQRKAA